MASIKESLDELLEIDGAQCVSLVDGVSGMILGEAGSGIDMELAAAGNTEVVRAKNKTMKSLGLQGTIEDMLITLDDQYHILRPMNTQDGLFLYLVLNKSRANLALARRKVKNVEENLVI